MFPHWPGAAEPNRPLLFYNGHYHARERRKINTRREESELSLGKRHRVTAALQTYGLPHSTLIKAVVLYRRPPFAVRVSDRRVRDDIQLPAKQQL